jgi:hypothetical protein
MDSASVYIYTPCNDGGSLHQNKGEEKKERANGKGRAVRAGITGREDGWTGSRVSLKPANGQLGCKERGVESVNQKRWPVES